MPFFNETRDVRVLLPPVAVLSCFQDVTWSVKLVLNFHLEAGKDWTGFKHIYDLRSGIFLVLKMTFNVQGRDNILIT